MMPRHFFFGLIEVNRWGYMWGYTAAQVELFTADVPFVAYKARDDKPKPGQKGFTRTAAQAEKEYQQWLDRQRMEKEKGVAIKLDTFLTTGKIEEKKK